MRVFPAVLCLFVAACSPTYVLRAGYEEARVLWRRQPIEDLLRDPNLPRETRRKLELVLDVRRFAADKLQLRAGQSYTSLSQVDEQQIVHVVSAAPRFELRAHTWWFPVVGQVPYKGFFSKADARAEAAALESQGLDTYVRPSLAFSTLGWFADPLLSSLLRYEPELLAELIIHELLHNTTYLAGHAEFDESFATFVGYRGAAQYFAERGDIDARQELDAAWRDALQFSDFIGALSRDLQQAYARGISLEERSRLFEGAQASFAKLDLETATYRDFASRPLNNAVILQHAMYAQRLRLFDEAYAQDRDLGGLIRRVVAAIHADSGDPFTAVEKLVGASRRSLRTVRAD